MVREKLQELSRDALLYGLGDALGRLVGLAMFPILSRVFVPADYGSIDLLTVSFVFLAILVQLEIPSGIQRFYFRKEGDERREMVTSCIVFLVGIASVVGGLIAWQASRLAPWVPERTPGVAEGIALLGAALPFAVASEQMILLLRLERRAIAFSAVNIVKIVITPTVTAIAVVGLDMGVSGVFLAQLSSLAMVTLLVAILTRHHFVARWNGREVVAALRFSLSGHPATLIRQGMNILPRYVLAAFAPMQAVGLFGVGIRVAGIQRVFMAAFNRAWNPFAYANEGHPEEGRLYELATKGMVGILVLTSLVLAIFAPEVLSLLAPGEYAPAALLVPGITLYFALDGLATIYTTVLYTRNAVRWTSYLGALRLILFLVISGWLVPRYEAPGLVASMLLSSIVYVAGFVFVAWKLLPFRVPWVRVVAYVALAGAVLFASRLFDGALLPTLLVKTTGVVIVLGAAYYLLFSGRERSSFRTLLRRGRMQTEASASADR